MVFYLWFSASLLLNKKLIFWDTRSRDSHPLDREIVEFYLNTFFSFSQVTEGIDSDTDWFLAITWSMQKLLYSKYIWLNCM